MRRTALKARNERRRASEFARAYGSEARVMAIKALACYACVKGWPSENAHLGNGGMGRKADWTEIVNLCADCHRELHALGSVERFDAKHGTDLRERARFLAEYIPASADYEPRR